MVRVRAPPHLQQAEVQHPHQGNQRLGSVNKILSLRISGCQVSGALLSEIFYQQPLQPYCLSQVGLLNDCYIQKYNNSLHTSTTPEITEELSRAPQIITTKKYNYILYNFTIFLQLCDLPSWTEWLWLFLSCPWLQNRVKLYNPEHWLHWKLFQLWQPSVSSELSLFYSDDDQREVDKIKTFIDCAFCFALMCT